MQVLCGKCGRGVDVGDAATGEKVVCPHCRASLKVPRLDPGDTMAGAEGAELGFAELSRRELSGTIEVGCNQCRRVFVVSTEFAGQRAKCPACGHIVQVPVFDDAARAQGAAPELDESSVFSEDIKFTSAQKGAPQSPGPAPAAPQPPPDEELPPLVVDPPPPAAEVLSAVSAPEPVRGRRRRRADSGQLIKYSAIAGMILVGAVAAILVHEIVNSPPRRVRPPERAQPGTNAGTESPAAGAAEGPPADGGTAAASAGQAAEAGVIGMSVDVFAGDGYLAAHAGREFWKCEMVISAGDTDVVLGRGGGQATLSAGDADGELVAMRHARSGLRPTTAAVVIPAKTKRQVTFVFDMPAGSTASVSSARLEIVDVGVYYVPVRKDTGPAEGGIFGTYTEMPPRNLKPLLRDPIMAAIQGTPQQKMVIASDGGNGLIVSLPAASVTGEGWPDGEDMYRLELTDGRDTLSCRLRALSGNRALLYLADEPFHQITFGNIEGVAAETLAPPPRGLAEIAQTPGFELPDGSEVQPLPTPAPPLQVPDREGDDSIFDP